MDGEHEDDGALREDEVSESDRLDDRVVEGEGLPGDEDDDGDD